MEPGFNRIKSKKPMDAAERKRVLDQLHRETAQRAAGYRERALKLFPHVCASCAREFSGVRLKELTVHHKDHNHDNNPPDGSNWELLCLYCHDNEHSRQIDHDAALQAGVSATGKAATQRASAQPFANLKDLLKSSSR